MFNSKERQTDLVLARPGFLGKCSGEFGGGEVCRGLFRREGVEVLHRKVFSS